MLPFANIMALLWVYSGCSIMALTYDMLWLQKQEQNGLPDTAHGK